MSKKLKLQPGQTVQLTLGAVLADIHESITRGYWVGTFVRNAGGAWTRLKPGEPVKFRVGQVARVVTT